jgi:uncharacterized protein
MNVFFDASAFVKRYIEEPGSEKVVEICKQADQLTLSFVCLPEIVSILTRLVRDGGLSVADYKQIKRLLLGDFEDVEVCGLSTEVIQQTMRCLETYALHSLGATTIGCALVVAPDLFVSSDQRQIRVAQTEGLEVAEL